MAKGKNDLILRDRLQFTLDASGNLPVVYGRIDLSDYVSVVNNEGLKIKEVRVQVRDTQGNTGLLNSCLLDGSTNGQASMYVFATTTAYESAADVGIASPNVFFNAEYRTYQDNIGSAGAISNSEYFEFGTPDLHPEGYVVVSDVLIGIAAATVNFYPSTTLEADVMLIAEPTKVTKDELKDMLAQATDL